MVFGVGPGFLWGVGMCFMSACFISCGMFACFFVVFCLLSLFIMVMALFILSGFVSWIIFLVQRGFQFLFHVRIFMVVLVIINLWT